MEFNEAGGLDLREEISFNRGLLAEIAGNLSTGESLSTWSLLKKASARLTKAIGDRDPRAIMDEAEVVARLVDRGHADALVIRDVHAATETIRKCAETEVKRLNAEQGALSIDDALMLADMIADVSVRFIEAAARDELDEMKAKSEFSAEMKRLASTVH